MGAHEVLGVFEDYSAVTTGITQSRASTNIIDMVKVKHNMGAGQHAPYLCIRTAKAPGLITDTLSIELQCHEDDTFDAGNIATAMDYTKVWTVLGGPVAAELHADVDTRLTTAGAWIYRGTIPYECDERYVRLWYYQTATGDAFFIDAWLQDGPPTDFRGSQVLVSTVGQP